MSADGQELEEAVDYEAEGIGGNVSAIEGGVSVATQPTTATVPPTEQMEPNPKQAAEEQTAGGQVLDLIRYAYRTADEGANDPMTLPPHGTEVFIGGIPKTATEAQIREFAEQAGKVYSVKLAEDPNNPENNRGFGFVRYTLKASADSAKETLHETQLKGTDARVRVSSSQSKHRVYVANIPRSWTKDQLLDEMNKNVRGLESMDLVMSKEAAGENRGFAFLTFYNHECAAAAKDFLGKSSYCLEGRQLTASYADPKNAEAPQPQQQQSTVNNKAVYVGNLPPGATDERLKELFSPWGKVTKVVIPTATERRPEQRFGFVHFSDHASAGKAVNDAAAGHKPELEGNILMVKAARPQNAQPDSRFSGEGMDTGYGYGYGYGYGFDGRQLGGRMPARGRGGRSLAGQAGRLRGRSGRGSGSSARGGFAGYSGGSGYEDGPWGIESGHDGSYDTNFDAYGGGGQSLAVAAPAGVAAGMTMVPMMLPSGQVGYVLQSADPMGPMDYGSYGPFGPDRNYLGGGDFRGGRGRGRGQSRYRPY